MKIRNGFVSNSSSSSFMILGDNLGHRAPDKFESDIWVVGTDLGEGSDVFPLTKEMFNYLIEHKNSVDNPISFIRGIAMSDGEIVEKKSLPDRFKAYMVEASYHSTDSLEAFMANYFPPPEKEECH
jgi:hypothetical protein